MAVGKYAAARPIIGERPTEGLAIEILGSANIGDIEFGVVDAAISEPSDTWFIVLGGDKPDSVQATATGR